MAVTYWLFPQLSGKRLRLRGVALVQVYLWFVGMTLMSNAMHRGGLAGLPRRTAEPLFENVGAALFEPVVGSVAEMQLQIAVGGTLLFVSLALFLTVVVATWLGSPTGGIRVNGLIPEPLSGAEHAPLVLDNLRLWTAIAVVLVLLTYGIPLWAMAADGLFAPGSPPFPV